MMRFGVNGWYRYGYGGDEKDFITKEVIAKSEKEAKEIFKQMYNRRFFSINVTKL